MACSKHLHRITHLPYRPLISGRIDGSIAAASTALRSGAAMFTRVLGRACLLLLDILADLLATI
jgi:hypothetical protein